MENVTISLEALSQLIICKRTFEDALADAHLEISKLNKEIARLKSVSEVAFPTCLETKMDMEVDQ